MSPKRRVFCPYRLTIIEIDDVIVNIAKLLIIIEDELGVKWRILSWLCNNIGFSNSKTF
jgi:hypothetical protein